jgi:hypothetical protein
MAALLKEHPQERELCLDEQGKVIEGLKPGALNDFRLQCMYDKIQAGTIVHPEDVVRAMGNAYITKTDRTTMEPSPCWLEAMAEEIPVVQRCT